MKNLISLFALICFVSTTCFAQLPKVNKNVQVNKNIKVNKNIRANLNPSAKFFKPTQLKANCADLAAADIQFQLNQKYSATKGLVRITGIVKNVGQMHYIGEPSDVRVSLFEISASGSRKLLSAQSFPSLTTGQSRRVSYYVKWDTKIPATSRYELVITYDANNHLDNNPRNDDCNPRNNRKQAHSRSINGLFTNS